MAWAFQIRAWNGEATLPTRRQCRHPPRRVPLPSACPLLANPGGATADSYGSVHQRDADTHEVVAVELTQDDVGDVSELVGLLDQVATGVASVIADGAYDGETVYDAVTDRHPEADIIIPPQATAVPSTSGATQRDQHIATIEKHGRIGWQRRSGYNRRSIVETAMYRYKTIIGRRLYARILSGQRVEAKIGCNVLNRMTSFGMPATIRIG